MELAHSISNELLSCKICFCQYSRAILPKLLLCPHTFCEPCLKRLVKKTKPGGQGSSGATPPGAGQLEQIVCPVCREVTTLGERGVKGLANNLTVLTLMDMLPSSDSASVSSTTSGTTQSPSAFAGTGAIPKRSPRSPPRETQAGECSKCQEQCTESQLQCGHCICDSCLRMHIQEGGDCYECPSCGALTTGDASPRRGRPSREATSGSAAIGTASATRESARPPRPMPAPRTGITGRTTAERGAVRVTVSPPGGIPPVATRTRSSQDNVQVSGRSPGRPPPFNPGYQGASGGAAGGATGGATGGTLRRSSQGSLASAAGYTERKRSISPGGGARAESGDYRRNRLTHPDDYRSNTLTRPGDYRGNRLTDPDNLSLCSVSSESRLSSSHHRPGGAGGPDPLDSSLRRTQSMRRPPPPPQRDYGTLQRQGRVRMLSPPQPNLSHSAENIRGTTNEALLAEARQRRSLAEGSGPLQGPSCPLGVSPPVPPPRTVFKSQPQSPTKLVKKFGSYSEVNMQTSSFRIPSRVGLSEKGDIVIVDTRNMTVQLFTLAGDYVSMFKVLGVQDACFMTTDKLCVASHMGVHIYSCSGVKVMDMPIGNTVAVTPYKFGFIAASAKSLRIYRQSFSLVKEITKFKSVPSKKWSPIHKKTQVEFHSIRDVAVTPTKYFAVLDGGSNWVVHIINEDAVCSAKIDPAPLQCGPFSNPESITTDFSNNIYVADSEKHRVLKFNSSGGFVRCVLSFRSREPNAKKIFPRGIAVTETGHIIVGLTGDHIAEIRVFSQLP